MHGAMPHLMKFAGKLAGENVRPTIPHLDFFAIARALICMSVNFAGVDPGAPGCAICF